MDDMYNRITHLFRNARNFTIGSGGNFSSVQGDQYNHTTIIKLPPFADVDTARRLLQGITSDSNQDTYLEYEREAQQVVADSHVSSQDGRLISECEREVQRLGKNPPVYYVAFHDGVVKKAAFVDPASARAFYNLVSTNYAKLLTAHRTSMNEVLTLAFHGTPSHIERCKDVGEKFGSTILLREAPFTAAFHRSDTIYMAFFVDLASAHTFYKALSYAYAKVLVERTPSGLSTLASHCGSVDYASECRNAILANKNTRTLQSAPFVVSLHEQGEIKTALFQDQESGQLFYDALPEDYAKVLLDRDQTETIEVEMHCGYDESPIIQCREHLEEVRFPETLEGLTFTIAFHEKGEVRLAGFVDSVSTLAFFETIPQECVKILKRQTSLYVPDFGFMVR